MRFALSDSGEPGTFEAIVHALDAVSRDTIGPAAPCLRLIPIRDDDGAAIGGLWAISRFRWLHVEMLRVAEPMRGQGVGRALMALAESEAGSQDCPGIYADTFSFRTAPFYRKMGFSRLGALNDCPPGHVRLFFQKRLVPECPA